MPSARATIHSQMLSFTFLTPASFKSQIKCYFPKKAALTYHLKEVSHPRYSVTMPIRALNSVVTLGNLVFACVSVVATVSTGLWVLEGKAVYLTLCFTACPSVGLIGVC